MLAPVPPDCHTYASYPRSGYLSSKEGLLSGSARKVTCTHLASLACCDSATSHLYAMAPILRHGLQMSQTPKQACAIARKLELLGGAEGAVQLVT